MTTPQIESRFIGPGGVCKASTTAKAASATHTAHSDHASQATVRRLIPPTPRSCLLAPSVTTPLYSATVSQTLRQPLRGEGLKKYALAPATHEDIMMALRMSRWGIQVFSPTSVLLVNASLKRSQSHEVAF